MLATHLIHQNPKNEEFTVKYDAIRKMMDYKYYNNYTLLRQAFQDQLITSLTIKINDSDNDICCPEVIFLCGSFGAGKSYTIKKYKQSLYSKWNDFLLIDPDQIKNYLPEAQDYAQRDSKMAATWLHQESTFISMMMEYLGYSKNWFMIVDGSLYDYEWYLDHFKWINEHYPNYRIGLIYVSAPLEVALSRCYHRGLTTGRQIPEDLISNRFDSYSKIFETFRVDPLISWWMHIHNETTPQIQEQSANSLSA